MFRGGRELPTPGPSDGSGPGSETERKVGGIHARILDCKRLLIVTWE